MSRVPGRKTSYYCAENLNVKAVKRLQELLRSKDNHLNTSVGTWDLSIKGHQEDS